MKMTLDDAIQHCKEVVIQKENQYSEWSKYGAEITKEGNECLKCAENHRQLAKWLEELKIVHDVIDDLEDYDEVMVGYLRKKMRGEI